MTSKKQLKARVRARMAKTGESYMTALRHIGGADALADQDHGYTLRGGLEPGSSNIANVLAHYGQTVDEALIFGIGGGLGAGYILWAFKQHDLKVLTLGFRNQWQYPDAWTQKTLERLGIKYVVEHSAGAAGAARRLSEELAAGRPCIVRPDRYHIGYWRLPEAWSGFGGQDVVVYAEQDGMVHVDDRNVSPLLVPRADLDAARARVSSYKNSLYVLAPSEISADKLRSAIHEGLREQVEHLSSPSDSFSLPAWRKWARLLTDTRNAKAWPKVFADRRGLAGALTSIWEGPMPLGMTGGNGRGQYAQFLSQAADLLGAPALTDVAAAWRDADAAWQAVAEAALPESRPDFVRLRELTSAVRQSVADPASSDAAEVDALAAELWRLRGALDQDVGLSDQEVAGLFESIAAAVDIVFERESHALGLQKDALATLRPAEKPDLTSRGT